MKSSVHLIHKAGGDLLFHALKLTTLTALEPFRREMALVSAAPICQRLSDFRDKPQF